MSAFDVDTPDDGPDAASLKGLPTRERDYLVPARDARGQSVRLMCRVSPEVQRLIAEVHQAKKYPFRVQGDLIRWCVVTQTKRLAEGAGLVTTIGQAQLILEMARDEEYHLQFDDAFRAVKRVVDAYIERGAAHKAREHLARIRGAIDMMPVGYWRSQYETELLRRYATILDARDEAEPGPAAVSAFAGVDGEHDE